MHVRAKIKICSETKGFSDISLVNTGATGIIADEALVDELELKVFGKVDVVTLGTLVKGYFTDVKNVVIEDVEIGPRRMVVCKFPREVKERLKSLGCSERVILWVSAVEDAGYFPNTAKGVLEKVGFLAL